jgi:hypothetical protein
MENQLFYHEKDELLKSFLQIYLQIPLRYHSELTLITEATPFNLIFSIEWVGDISEYPSQKTIELFLSRYGDLLWVDHLDGGVYMVGYRKNEDAERIYRVIPGEKIVDGVSVSAAIYRPSYSIDFYNRLPVVVKPVLIKPRIVSGSAWSRPLKF